MTDRSEPTGSYRTPRSRRRAAGWTLKITPLGVVFLVLINLFIVAALVFFITRYLQITDLPWQSSLLAPSNTPTFPTSTSTTTASNTPTLQPSESPTIQPSETLSPAPATPSPQPVSTLTFDQGLIVLALDEGANTHLFVYQPQESGAGQPLMLTRLTSGPWDDINPALSPDGQTIAFASSRSGYWDIYLLNLASGGITRLTDTFDYDGAPCWSPDNQWLAYETYTNNNLEIKIQSVVNPGDAVPLTEDAAADFSPAWSPLGRQIAFVSNKSGENEVWLADLDKAEDQRFTNISNDPSSPDIHPAWSPDGKSLVWVGEQDGIHSLLLKEMTVSDGQVTPQGAVSPRNVGSGDWPAWSTDGEIILSVLDSPNHEYLTAYPAHYPGLVFPTLELPGEVGGLSWGSTRLSTSLQSVYQQSAQITPTALFQPGLASLPADNGGRYLVIPLDGINAPNPYLHDLVDESFQALRSQIARKAGWDFLSTLENAYVPITSPLDPGMGNDWLYTGRAFTLDTLPLDAGWMVVMREDFSGQTYWRVFIKSLYQDGSVGIPLHDLPWNFEARNDGNNNAYEQGGEQMSSVPSGYWIDFTRMALAYGWERLPALTNWTAFFPAARFNEFADTGGLNWESAMLELYPPEVMITPSPVVPPSRTPTSTVRWYESPTPTTTPTPRPTFTPYPLPTASVTPGG
jgi:TolB protein